MIRGGGSGFNTFNTQKALTRVSQSYSHIYPYQYIQGHDIIVALGRSCSMPLFIEVQN